jgi:hypothetical protein
MPNSRRSVTGFVALEIMRDVLVERDALVDRKLERRQRGNGLRHRRRLVARLGPDCPATRRAAHPALGKADAAVFDQSDTDRWNEAAFPFAVEGCYNVAQALGFRATRGRNARESGQSAEKCASSRYAARFFPWAGKMHCRSAGPDIETGTQLAYQ